MPKPTSPQPLVLTDEECDGLARRYTTLIRGVPVGSERFVPDMVRELIRAVYVAGCEAQRRVDADWLESTRPAGPIHTDRQIGKDDALHAAAIDLRNIERTPEQPTTQRCVTCGSDDPAVRMLPYRVGSGMYCDDAFHSQPTTGEAAHVHEDGKDCGCKDA